MHNIRGVLPDVQACAHLSPAEVITRQVVMDHPLVLILQDAAYTKERPCHPEGQAGWPVVLAPES